MGSMKILLLSIIVSMILKSRFNFKRESNVYVFNIEKDKRFYLFNSIFFFFIINIRRINF